MIPAEWGRRTGDFTRLPRTFMKWLHQVRHLISFTISPIHPISSFFRFLSAPSPSHESFVTSFQLVLLKRLSTGDSKMPLTQHEIHPTALAQPQG